MRRNLLHPSRGRLARSLVIALALASLVFLLQISTHTHTNGQEEAACLLCQAAHIGATPAVSTVALSVPFVPVGQVSAPSVSSVLDSFFHHSDPRAPPASIQL